MSQDFSNMPASEKPDLKRESILGSIAKGFLGYAVLGAAVIVSLGTGLKAIARVPLKQILSELPHDVVGGAFGWGAFGAFFGWNDAVIRNHEKAKIKPYVESLERENDTFSKILHVEKLAQQQRDSILAQSQANAKG